MYHHDRKRGEEADVMAARRSSTAPEPESLDAEQQRDAVLDAALVLAGERGWGEVHLYDVADRMGLSLAEIARLFPDKDAVGNRLFARAGSAMLALRDDAGFRALAAQERIYRAITAWFAALGPHQATARDIFLYKLAPSHLHHQAALVVALSRTVQWVREAALLPATGRGRRREETWLTLLFAATLLFWFADRSPNQERSYAFLRRRIESMSARFGWK
jgi:ubiquinone biosynthesis protein COQ9